MHNNIYLSFITFIYIIFLKNTGNIESRINFKISAQKAQYLLDVRQLFVYTAT